ncbi:MAG: hypothetical protein R3C60_07325 [Parvularculaceae bacterium]
MTNSSDNSAASPDEAGGEGTRLRLKGITTADDGAESPEMVSFEAWASAETRGREISLARRARIYETVGRMFAGFIFAAVFIGWPLGTLAGHYAAANTLEGWTIGTSFGNYILLGVIGPPAAWLLGHLAARMTMMIGASEAIAIAAQQFVQPDKAAIRNVETVGSAVRGQMETLNAGIDDALIRLASAEAMIRQHVGAIEQAGAAIETHASGASDRVASERARLIELTETLNSRADEFATAIAEKAQANISALADASNATLDAETRLDDRLARLEVAAQRALQSFESLSMALDSADENVRERSGAIEASAMEVKRATEIASKIADAAAETAARNAANVGLFSTKAAEDAKKSADSAIEAARNEAKRVAEATARAVEDVTKSTRKAVEGAAGEADRAASAADLVSEAAKKATSVAHAASEEVKKASEAAQKSAHDAVQLSETASKRAEARNKELADARASLEAENARLEALIEEQRRRADRLAEAIATQTERLSKLAESQLREQEAAARLAEAQAAIQKQRADETKRNEDAELQRRETEKRRKAETERASAAPAQKSDDANVLELGKKLREMESQGKRPPREADPDRAARLDELANDISRGRNGRAANGAGANNGDERRSKHDVSWSEILSKTDEAEPLDLGVENRKDDASRAADAIDIVAGLQEFTLDLERRLYGEPPPALLERFERGDRNVFANRLLRLNESDVKRRIRGESGRDKPFERSIHGFLQGFETLLEDATTSETADEELEQYLSSPLGRVYLLVGATVGYFA